jgi:hypothetical protein
MLIIRNEQRAAFKADRREQFKRDVLIELEPDFPEDFKVLGETQVRKVIDLGIERAEAHGLRTQDEIEHYIRLMFVLGSYFDEDLQLPWAGRTLREAGPVSVRFGKLRSLVTRYLRSVAGFDGEHYRRALLRARGKSFESLTTSASGNLVDDIRAQLAELYPQQYRVTTGKMLADLIAQGRASAENHGMGNWEGTVLYVVLMFMLGSTFDHDPLHAWATVVLNDQSVEPELKARQLHAAALVRLEMYIEANRAVKGI